MEIELSKDYLQNKNLIILGNKSDLKVEIDGTNYTNFDVGKNSNGDTTINFKQSVN